MTAISSVTTDSIQPFNEVSEKEQNCYFELIDMLSIADRTFLVLSLNSKKSSQRREDAYLSNTKDSVWFQKKGGIPQVAAAIAAVAAEHFMANQGCREITIKVVSEQLFPGAGGLASVYCQGKSAESTAIATLKLEEIRNENANPNSSLQQKISELLEKVVKAKADVAGRGG
jgi:hypothetical protein